MNRFVILILFIYSIFSYVQSANFYNWNDRQRNTIQTSKYLYLQPVVTPNNAVRPIKFSKPRYSSDSSQKNQIKEIEYYYTQNDRGKASKQSALELRREDPKCNGLDNFISDIGVMSYVLGFVGTLIGFLTLLVALLTQIQTFLSTYIVGVPSSFLTLNGMFGDPSSIPTAVTNMISLFGLIDTFVNLTFATNVNGLLNVIDIYGAIISFISLYIGVASTFPSIVKDTMKVLQVDAEALFASYGCPENKPIDPFLNLL